MKKMPLFVAPVKNNLGSISSQNRSSDQEEKCSQNSIKSSQDILEIGESIMGKMANKSQENINNIEDPQKMINGKYKKKKQTTCVSEIAISKMMKVKQGKKYPKNRIIDVKIKKSKNVPHEKEKKIKEQKLDKDGLKKIVKVNKGETNTHSDEIKNKEIKLTEKKTKKDSLEPIQVAESMTQTFSQSSYFSTVFRELILSQPPKTFTHKQKLVWLQERRQVGVWVECCRASCRKWRYIQDTHDPLQVPEKWYCEMNSDANANSCNKKELATNVLEEEDLIHALYSAGSLVWAHLDGFPWWPAMIDDCPDTEQYYWLDGFSDIPNFYNVTFFDSMDVTRAWVATDKLKPYVVCGKKVKFEQSKIPATMKHRMSVAKNQADAAMNLTVLERLRKYSFITRYTGPINSPKGELIKKTTKIHCKSPTSTNSSDSNSDSSESETATEEPVKIFGIKNLNVCPPSIDQVLPIYQEITAKIDKEIISREKMSFSSTQQDNLLINSANSVSEETSMQSQTVCTKDGAELVTQDVVKSASLTNQTHSNTCVDMSEALDSEKTEIQNIDLASDEETEESIFRNLCASDAIVPCTETNIVALNMDDSEILSQKSLDFEMF